MSLALDTALNDHFKARPYHVDKRFHSSFMMTNDTSTSTSNSASPARSTSSSEAEDQSRPSIATPDPRFEESLPKLQDIRVQELKKLAEELNSRHGAELRAFPPFELPQLGIRVGSRVTWLQLS